MKFKGRSFLTLKDYTKDEIVSLIELAAALKAKKKGADAGKLEGKLLDGVKKIPQQMKQTAVGLH